MFSKPTTSKIPLIAWDEYDGKYAVFPYHLLQTFDDGTQGFYLYSNESNTWHDNLERADALKRFRRCFWETPMSWGYSDVTRRYILKCQKDQCTHRRQWDSLAIPLALWWAVIALLMLTGFYWCVYQLGATFADFMGIK